MFRFFAVISMLLGFVPPEPASLTITSMNVCARHCPNLAPFSERAPNIAASLTEGQPAVIVVQEAGRGDVEVALLNELLTDHGYTHVVGQKARHIFAKAGTVVHRTGVVTAQRTPASKVTTLPWAEVEVDGRRLIVTSVHLSSSDGKAKDLDRLHEVQTLTDALPEGVAVLVGDFNSLDRRDDPRYDADANRFRVHEALTSSGWTFAATPTTTYVQQPGDTRRLPPVLNFDRSYVRGMVPGSATALDDEGLSDHVAVRFEVR